MRLGKAMVEKGLCHSMSQARRMVKQASIRVDGVECDNADQEVDASGKISIRSRSGNEPTD